jgi:hypothetical protein
MDLTKVLAQLHLELEHLDAAIVSLEQLQQKSEARRMREGSPMPRRGSPAAPKSDEPPAVRRQGGREK